MNQKKNKNKKKKQKLYNCVASTSIVTNKIFLFSGPPIVRLFERFISVQEGLTVNLSCHYLAKPRPTNSSYWAFNGVEIIPTFRYCLSYHIFTSR